MRRKVAYPALVGFAVTSLYMTQMLDVPVSVLSQKVVHVSDRAWPEAHILFVGDMSFDRTVRTFGDRHGYEALFSCASDVFTSYDAVVGNLEGPITEHDSVSIGTIPGDLGNTQFTFPSSVAYTLARYNVKAVSLANNHIRDFGVDGVMQTRKFLDDAFISYFGVPGDPNAQSVRMVINSVPVVLVGFNQFLGGNSDDKVAATIAEIQKYPPDERVVVFAHWGDEYVGRTKKQQEWAHTFVDAGADLVIGAHPHVVQEQEVYNGVSIFYSVGNFIFDQYWESSVREGLGVGVTFGRRGVADITTIPFVRTNTPAPCPITGSTNS